MPDAARLTAPMTRVTAGAGSACFAGCLDTEGDARLAEQFANSLRRSSAAALNVQVSVKAVLANRPGAVQGVSNDGMSVAFSGDITWSDTELGRLCEAQGLVEAIAAAYRRDGAEAPRHMHGAFAVVIIDPATNSLFAAIDRMGIRSLCYAADAQRIVIGGEAHDVAAHPRVGNDIDPQAIYDYLFSHVVPAPGTIYRGIRKLLPAQYLHWRAGRLEIGFYWALRYHARAAARMPELESRFLSLLETAVADSVRGAGRVAAFLSGGTDSSTVTGMLSKVQGGRSDAYSIGFEAEGFDEMAYARIAARHFGARHHPYYVTPRDVLAMIPKVAAAYDEPFGNASAVAAYYCAKLAHDEGVSTMLAGDGGDELFGGNARYAKQKVFEAYWRIPGLLRRRLLEPALLGVGDRGSITPLRKAASYVRQAMIPLPDRLESYNFLLRESHSAMFMPEFLRAVDVEHPARLAREVYQRTEGGSFIDRMMHLDLKLTLADNDLRKVNRMCELAGVAVRYPMLDEALVDFSGEVPAGLKVRGLKLRYFFKHALRNFLPPETIKKTKQGFGLPFGIWLQEDAGLRDLATASLHSFRARGYLRPECIDALLQKHEHEHASYYGVMIWVVVMLEQWLEAHRG